MNLVYDRLWLRLGERGLTAQDLKQGTRLSSATVAKLRKNAPVHSTTLERVCTFLDCKLEDIATQSPPVELISEPVSGDQKQLRLNSFFSGVGGFELGFEPAGFDTQMQCEIDAYCHQVLERHWPDIPIYADVSTLDPADLPEADVWVAGFPCQDISVARGKSERLGLHGERSGLFHQFSDLIEASRPSVVVLENVAGLLNSNKGRDFGTILQRMTGMGYTVAWRILNSRYFGVPQSRPRTYVVCWLGDSGAAAKSLFEDAKVPTPKAQRQEFIEVGTEPGTYPITPKTSYCLAATSGRHTGTDWSRTYVVCSEGVRRMTPVEYERLQGFPDGWTLPAKPKSADELDTLRYKAVGNAVSVPVINWIANRIARQLRSDWAHNSVTSDDIRTEIPSLEKAATIPATLAEIDFHDTTQDWKWSNSGIAGRTYVWHAPTPPAPAKPIVTNLGNLVQNQPQDSRYYLTPNAAEGILRRCAAQNRTLFAPLDAALRQLAKT